MQPEERAYLGVGKFGQKHYIQDGMVKQGGIIWKVYMNILGTKSIIQMDTNDDWYNPYRL